MVSKRCAESMNEFVSAVYPELSPDEVKQLADATVRGPSCAGEFKEVFINDNLRHYNPGVRNVIRYIAEEAPDAIRSNSYIEFADNVVTVADAELTGNKIQGEDVNEASRIVHAAVTTTDENPTEPTCGRMDTNVERLSELLKLDKNTSIETCVSRFRAISK
jgi:hypothetical protein